MKKTLLIALLLIPFWGFSQTAKPIDGFLGIKFGSSKTDVIAAMKAKGAVLNTSDGDTTGLIFNKVKLGSRDVDQLTVLFVNNKAFRAIYYFLPGDEANVPPYYQNLVKDFNDVYGAGRPIKRYIDPYKEDESPGDELLGLSVSKVVYFTVWKDAPSQNEIIAHIFVYNNSMSVTLTYQDKALNDLNLQNQKAKDNKDF